MFHEIIFFDHDDLPASNVLVYSRIHCISPYSVRMRENANQNNLEYGHFSRSVRDCDQGGLMQLNFHSQKILSHGTNVKFKLNETIVQLYFLSLFKESESQLMFSIKLLPATVSADGCGQTGDLLTDLLKTFNFLNHELLKKF